MNDMKVYLLICGLIIAVVNSACPGELSVTLTACPGFQYFGSWNSISLQIQGAESESSWFIINQDADLPSFGNSQEYCVPEDLTGVGEFIWLNIQAFENELFCLSQVEVVYDGQIYSFGSNTLGDGVFLGAQCKYNYLWLSDSYPLLPCYDNSFTLRTYQTRTIYNFDCHTCLRSEASVAVSSLQEDITFGLMVQNFNDTAWVDAGTFRFDHFIPNNVSGGFTGKRIGHLSTIDYTIEEDANSNDFTPPIEGTLIGFRMVLKDAASAANFGIGTSIPWDTSIFSGFNSWCEYFANSIVNIFSLSVFCNVAVIQWNVGEQWQYVRLKEEPTSNNGEVFHEFANVDCLEWNDNNKCIDILFHTSTQGYVTVKPGQRMAVETLAYGDGTTPSRPANTDIYLVYLGYEDIYQVPYIRLDLTDQTGKTFFDADQACQDTYGTNSASIHNSLSNHLAKMFCKFGENCWLGAYQYSENGNDDGYWRWTDNTGIFETSDVDFWTVSEPNDNDNKEDCAHIYGSSDESGGWNDLSCDDTGISTVICNSPYWYSDSTRTFQLNIDTTFDEIVLLSISNSGKDPFCIDYVSGERINNDHENKRASVKIGPTQWIGQKLDGEIDDQTGEILTNICNYVDCSLSTYAMFTLPVCQINIIETIVQDIEFGQISYEDASVAGLSCTNQNRFIDATCDVSQSIEVTEETGIEITHSEISGSEYTFAGGIEISVSPAWGVNYPYLTVTGSFEYSNTQYKEEENSRTEFMTQSTTKAIECTGSIDVPPNHAIDYILTLSQETVTLTTTNTLELILCSAFLSDDDQNTISEESGDVEYRYNVPGTVQTVTASVCEVTFDTTDRIISLELPCDEMNALAVRTGATYMPHCQENDSTKYDGCQCETGDKLTEAPCYCVNEITGAIIGGTSIFSEDSDWRDTCRQLACENSIYQPQPTAAPTYSPTTTPTYSPTSAPTFSPTASPTDLTQNIPEWEGDLTRANEGIICFYNPDIDNPYRLCVQLITIMQTNEICDTNSNTNQVYDAWHQYDWTIENSYQLNEPPNPPNSNIFVKEITVVVEDDITIKFQLFYNSILSLYENGLTSSIEIINGWPFKLNADNHQLYTLSIEYGVFIEGKPIDEYTETTQSELLTNSQLYYTEYFKNGHVDAKLIDGGLYYLLNSNQGFYDNIDTNRVGVLYGDEYFGPSDKVDNTDDNNDIDINYVRLCFHHFDDSLLYDPLEYDFV